MRLGGCAGHRVEAFAALVEEQLGQRVDGIEFAVERAAVEAAEAHLERRRSDQDGARAAGAAEADDEAMRLLATAYEEVLRWAVGIDATQPLDTAALPALVADELAGRRERYGWPADDVRVQAR
jgi:hypothetical protein